MKKIIALLTVFGLALCLSGSLQAQPSPEDPNNYGSGNDPLSGPAAAPIGGGASILVTFGIAYAISRYSTRKKEA